MNQSQLDICPLSLEPSSHLPPYPTPLGCHRTPDLNSSPYSTFPLAI